MTRDQLRQTGVGVGALVIWLLLLRSLSDFPSRAAAFPRFILLGLVVFSVLHVITQLVGAYADRRYAPATETTPQKAPDELPHELTDAVPVEIVESTGGLFSSPALRAVVFTVAVIAYVVAIPELGYLISTFLFVICALGLVVGFRITTTVACCVAVTVLWVVATQLLQVRLPTGLVS
jgi:hypothetical protein